MKMKIYITFHISYKYFTYQIIKNPGNENIKLWGDKASHKTSYMRIHEENIFKYILIISLNKCEKKDMR